MISGIFTRGVGCSGGVRKCPPYTGQLHLYKQDEALRPHLPDWG